MQRTAVGCLGAGAGRPRAAERAEMIARLELIEVRVAQPAAGPFLLLHVDDAELLRNRLWEKGIAV